MTKEKTQKGGQAAMEFLMTYGWAILAAIIAIGILAYLGVFSSVKYSPSVTIIQAPFYAKAWNVKSQVGGAYGSASIEILNQAPDDVLLKSVTISNCGTNNTLPNTNIPQGSTTSIIIPCNATSSLVGKEGTVFKGDITIAYQKPPSQLTLSTRGSMTEKITASLLRIENFLKQGLFTARGKFVGNVTVS